MNRWAFVLGLVAVTPALARVGEGTAKACGGCFHPPTQTASDITDERMLLAVSTAQSTLYDQIRYEGSPKNFAWVLPIHGTVEVGLSADVLFDSVDVLTETTIVPPEPNCPGPPSFCFFGGAGSGSSAPTAVGMGGAPAPPSVTVTKQQNVGPYATVQLHSTDGSALSTWLMQNGYLIPADVVPVITQYVSEGFDFLAMKLLPGQGVQAMRPVRVTTPGAGLSLPLRMAAVGTGAEVGITIWVVADGRYEPQNFPFFHIEDKDLVWDFAANLSNYTTLRVSNEAMFGGKGWELESSLALNERIITNVILSGGQYYGGYGGPGGGPGGIAAPPSDPSLDYLPVPASPGTPAQTAEEVRTADIAHLFAGLVGPVVRVTRMRSDIVHAAMTKDFLLQASADQAELPNVRNVTQSVNLQCPIYDNNCNTVGTGTLAQAQASIAAAEAAHAQDAGLSESGGPEDASDDASSSGSGAAGGSGAGGGPGTSDDASAAHGTGGSGAPAPPASSSGSGAAGSGAAASETAASSSPSQASRGCATMPGSGDRLSSLLAWLTAVAGIAIVRRGRRLPRR
jgi:hypothetical protein